MTGLPLDNGSGTVTDYSIVPRAETMQYTPCMYSQSAYCGTDREAETETQATEAPATEEKQTEAQTEAVQTEAQTRGFCTITFLNGQISQFREKLGASP